MILPALLGPLWEWGAKFAAPIGLAFVAGMLWAGRNCEEGKLREDIAALEATASVTDKLLTASEERRLSSEQALTDNLSAYQKALKHATENDPKLVECRGVALAPGLRLKRAPADSPSTR